MNLRNRNILFTTSLLQGLVFFIPVSTVYLQSKGITLAQMLTAEAVLMALLMVLDIPTGVFADRFGCRNTLILAFSCNFIAKILYYFISGFPLLILSRIFDAIAIAAASGSESAMVYATAGKEQSEKMFGRYYALYSLGILTASLSSTIIVGISMNLAVLLTVISYGAVVFLTPFLKEIKNAVPESANRKVIEPQIMSRVIDSLKYLSRCRNMLYFIISYALLHGVLLCMSQVINQQQYLRCGIDIRYFGLIYAVIQSISLLSDKTTVITGKIGQKNTLLIMYAVSMTGSFISVFTITALVLPFMIVMCAIFFLIAPIVNDIQNKATETNNKVTVLSIYSTIINGTTTIITLGVGKIINISISATFIICGVILLLSTALYLFYYFKEERNEEINPGVGKLSEGVEYYAD